jgi:hypothetical protein
MQIGTPEFWEAVEATALAQYVKESPWAYPALETVHLIGLGLLFGSIFAFDLRVLGVNRDLPIAALGRHLLVWAWCGFLLNATSGVALFVSGAKEFAVNPALQIKLVLILFAGLNAALFQIRLKPEAFATGSAGPMPAGARAAAALSIVLWFSIILAGRMIAYVD